MASKAESANRPTGLQRLRLDLLLRPMPPRMLLASAVVVLVAGAIYCTGYERLLTNRNNWPWSLLWAAYGLLPWLLLFEYVKRREWHSDQALSHLMIGLLMAGTVLASLGAEWLVQYAGSSKEFAVLLPAMRRLPGIGVFVLLVGLSRREQDRARRRTGQAIPDDNEIEGLRRHAPGIRFIQAADNYLELHAEGQVITRRVTMRAAEQALQPLGFVRVHRSVIVNRRHVDRVVQRSGGAQVRLIDGTALPIGRAFSANLRQLH